MQRNDIILVGLNALLFVFAIATGFFQPVFLLILIEIVLLQVWFFRKLDGHLAGQDGTHVQLLDALEDPFAEIAPRRPMPNMRVEGNWTATPDFAKLIVKTILEEKPQLIVELGSGVSSLICGYALEKNGTGKLVSLDHSKEFSQESTIRLKEHGLDHLVEVRHAPLKKVEGSTDVWYDVSALDDLTGIDLLIVDGPPAADNPHARYPALVQTIDRLSANAVILLDDGIRKGEQEIVTRWLREFPGFNSNYVHTEKGTFIMRKSPATKVVPSAVQQAVHPA